MPNLSTTFLKKFLGDIRSLREACVIYEETTVDQVIYEVKNLIEDAQYPRRINKIRLLRLADLLEGKGPYRKKRVDAKEFNIAVWTDNSCGMVACATGHAARDRWFANKGFRIVNDGFGNDIVGYQGLQGLAAVSAFFGISETHAHDLFTRIGYAEKLKDGMRCKPVEEITPKLVAKSIRKLVRDISNKKLSRKATHTLIVKGALP